jgi:hypothetical protein
MIPTKPSAALTASRPQDKDHDRDRDQKENRYDRLVIVTIAARYRLAGNENLIVGILVLLDNILDPVEELLVIKAPLIE